MLKRKANYKINGFIIYFHKNVHSAFICISRTDHNNLPALDVPANWWHLQEIISLEEHIPFFAKKYYREKPHNFKINTLITSKGANLHNNIRIPKTEQPSNW